MGTRTTSELLPVSAEIRGWDEATIASGIPGIELMRRAGRAVADRALAIVPDGDDRRVLVICGSGNNGGDGYVAARCLVERGRAVSIAALAGEPRGDAAIARGEWNGPVVPAAEAEPEGASLIVDALFGTGLRRDLEGEAASLVERVNASGAMVLAVDLPSGIDGDTGEVRGAAIRAHHTVALAARKPGHILYPGRAYAGQVEVADIGIPASITEASGVATFANGPALWREALPRARDDGHKYDRGHAVVLSGGPLHTGAARLAARGALRVGAGLVTLITSARALSVNAAHLTSIMLRVCDEPDELSDLLTDDRFNAVALGPALGMPPLP